MKPFLCIWNDPCGCMLLVNETEKRKEELALEEEALST